MVANLGLVPSMLPGLGFVMWQLRLWARDRRDDALVRDVFKTTNSPDVLDDLARLRADRSLLSRFGRRTIACLRVAAAVASGAVRQPRPAEVTSGSYSSASPLVDFRASIASWIVWPRFTEMTSW